MPYNPEQTHAKNLDHLRTAISIVESLGAQHQPNNSLIELAALAAFEAQATGVMQDVNEVLPAEDNAVDARKTAFQLVRPRVTKIFNAAKAQGLRPDFVAGLRTTANELRGVRVTAATPDNPSTPGVDESAGSHSSSNRSYAGILENLDRFFEQLRSNPGYAPNESEHRVVTLDAWLAELNALNQAAIDAKAPVRAARVARDNLMYNPEIGLLRRMELLKAYARSILPASDLRRKNLLKLRFRNPSG